MNVRYCAVPNIEAKSQRLELESNLIGAHYGFAGKSPRLQSGYSRPKQVTLISDIIRFEPKPPPEWKDMPNEQLTDEVIALVTEDPG